MVWFGLFSPLSLSSRLLILHMHGLSKIQEGQSAGWEDEEMELQWKKAGGAGSLNGRQHRPECETEELWSSLSVDLQPAAKDQDRLSNAVVYHSNNHVHHLLVQRQQTYVRGFDVIASLRLISVIFSVCVCTCWVLCLWTQRLRNCPYSSLVEQVGQLPGSVYLPWATAFTDIHCFWLFFFSLNNRFIFSRSRLLLCLNFVEQTAGDTQVNR